MSLIERINLINDGESLDGVGDNPDVINRPIKELISILESGGGGTLTIEKSGFAVDPSSWGTGVTSGDFVFYDISTEKYELTPLVYGERNMGVADLETNTLITQGVYTYPNGALTTGKMIYLDSTSPGKFVEEDSPNASLFLLGFVVDNDAILFNAGSGAGVQKTSNTGAAIIPTGSTSERDISPENGYFRYNSSTNEFEGFKNGSWQGVGGGQMFGQSEVKAISYNAQTIAEDITITAGLNAYTVGDVTIENGRTVTVENGSIWKIL